MATDEHEHTWTYRYGQGALFQCTTCKVWGSKYVPGHDPHEIVPQTCEFGDCANPAIHLVHRRAFRCEQHRHID